MIYNCFQFALQARVKFSFHFGFKKKKKKKKKKKLKGGEAFAPCLEVKKSSYNFAFFVPPRPHHCCIAEAIWKDKFA